jgi:NitT/TauT family transport system substrate-binding protein
MWFGRVACAIHSIVAMSGMRGRGLRRALTQFAYCVVVGLAFLLVAGAARAEPIKVAISQRGFWDSSFIEFAIREGFFKDEGIEVEPFYTEGGAGTLDVVMSGGVDIAMSNGLMGAVGRFSKGAPIRVVSAEMTGASDAFWYARTDSGISTLKDASGKTIAFSSPGSSTNLMVLGLVKQAGVAAKPVATGGAPATFTQVMTRQIDIGWSVPPFGLAQLAEGKIAIVAKGNDVPELAGQTLRVNVTRQDVLEQKRQLLTGFLKIYARAIDWAYQNDRSLIYFAEANQITLPLARTTREFYPKEALQMTEVKGLELTLRDAASYKYTAKRLEPKDTAALFDILYRP